MAYNNNRFVRVVNISDNFFNDIIDRKVKKTFSWPVMFENQGTFEANFPCETDDLVLIDSWNVALYFFFIDNFVLNI